MKEETRENGRTSQPVTELEHPEAVVGYDRVSAGRVHVSLAERKHDWLLVPVDAARQGTRKITFHFFISFCHALVRRFNFSHSFLYAIDLKRGGSS